jgi:hypothetical protein
MPLVSAPRNHKAYTNHFIKWLRVSSIICSLTQSSALSSQIPLLIVNQWEISPSLNCCTQRRTRHGDVDVASRVPFVGSLLSLPFTQKWIFAYAYGMLSVWFCLVLTSNSFGPRDTFYCRCLLSLSPFSWMRHDVDWFQDPSRILSLSSYAPSASFSTSSYFKHH